jgi:Family of unknown function (DUF6510)
MDPVDGNSIAGELYDHFGGEMTTAIGSCVHCGTTGRIAELVVYGRPPGTIARCPACGSVTIAIVRARERTLVTMAGFKLREVPAEG